MNISWSQSVLSRMRRSIPISAYPPTPLFWPQLHESPINMRVAGTLLSRQLARDPWGSVACGQNRESKGLNAGPRGGLQCCRLPHILPILFWTQGQMSQGSFEKAEGGIISSACRFHSEPASPYRIAASSVSMFISFRALNRMQYPVTLALPSFSPYVLAKYFLSFRPRI